ncbi:unnamed protein product [Hymenolepis diminuta]|uniref:Uncharacterized protein n=1 Tax=Hymenolepis diminuta TaxID=6216 RepID=A0A564Z8I8_HYMDI|nr:unnamed protein product [Hymenolepis diminuta]
MFTADPKDYLKNVGIFHHNPLIDESFATWYTQHRDIYKNFVADLPHATRITMQLRGFNSCDHSLCSSYFQPMDPADLTYVKIIVSDLVLWKKTSSVVSFSFLVFDLLAMLIFDSKFCPFWT